MIVKNKSRSHLLSITHSIAVVAVNNVVISDVETEPQHFKNLWINTIYFKDNLHNLIFNIGNLCTPIIPLILGDFGPAQEITDILFRTDISPNI